MTVPITIKYNSVAVEHVTNLNYTNAMKFWGTAKFYVPNQLGENFDTWKGYRHQELIEIFETATNELKWSGYVEGCINTDPMEVNCLGVFSKLAWDVLTEDGGKMIIDSLLIKQAPTTDIQVILDTEDEDKDPGLTDNQWGSVNDKIDRYAIISDATRAETTGSFDPAAVTVSGGVTIAGDHTDLTDQDASFWHVDTQDDLLCKCRISWDMANQGSPIAVTEEITKIKIILAGKLTAEQGMFYPPALWDIYWSRAGISGNFTLLPNWTIQTPQGGSDGVAFYFEEEIEVETGHGADWFTEGGINWEGGFIFIRKAIMDVAGVYDADIYIDKAEIIVSHSSASFETINRLIRDVDVDVGFDIIQVNNDAEDGDYDLTNKGITTNDRIEIGIGIVEGFDKINNTGYPFVINGGTNPKKGVTQNYVGVYNSVSFQQLIAQMVYTYFTSYWQDGAGNNFTEFKILSESDIAAAVVTYDKDNDPPTWKNPKSAEPNEYGFVVVKYFNGGMTGKITAASPGSDPRTLLVDAPYILTRAEAEAYGLAKAEYHALEHLNIPLVWGNFPANMPEVGVKYDYTGLKWNGAAVVNDTHTDQICRRLTVKWKGAQSLPIVKAWLGGGETDPDEKLGKWEALIEHRQRVAAVLTGTTVYGPITRYAQLLGLPDLTLKLDIADIDDVPVNAVTEAPISSNWAFDHKSSPANINHLTDAQVAALHAVYTDAEAIAAVLADDAYVKLIGDTMLGDLSIEKTTGDTTVTFKNTNDDVFFNLDAVDDSVFYHRVSGTARALINWDEGESLWRFRMVGTPALTWELDTSTERMRLTDTELRPGANKGTNMGTAAIAWDTIWADDFTNVASEQKYTVPSDEEIYEELKAGEEPYIKEIKIKQWIEDKLRKEISHYEIIDGKEVPIKIEVPYQTIEREEVPLDYIAQKDETLETHHARSHSHNIDYLNGVIRKLILEIEELKKKVLS